MLLFLLLLSFACTPDPGLFPGRDRSRTEEWPRIRKDGLDTDETRPPDTLVYVLAVEYPESYDWERDTASGSAECRLSLYLGKEQILSLKAGAVEGISPDPDMARIRDGHLYTDFSTDTETLIKKDGVELFRYSGRESIRGFLVRGDHVHTLGQSRSGSGFSYRIDGKEIFRRDIGTVLGDGDHPGFDGGALWEEDGRICFSFVRKETEGLTVFLVADGEVEREDRLPGTVLVHDQRRIGGVLYRVENRKGGQPNPVIVSGDRERYGLPFAGTAARKCLIYRNGKDISVTGYFRINGEDLPYYWIDGSWKPATPRETASIFFGEGELAILHRDRFLFKGQVTPLITRQRLISPRCITVTGGRLYAALTGKPCSLYAGDFRFDYPIHGFLSAVHVEIR